jgi:hypothetical protein
MTVNSCAGYRSPNALNDKQSEQLTGRPPAVPGLPRILPKRLEPTPEVAEHGTMVRTQPRADCRRLPSA